MSLDFLQSDHIDDMPLFAALKDPRLAAPYFNKWTWLPHPETNAKSGIFVRCNNEYVDEILDLPERVPVKYGQNVYDIHIPEAHHRSLESPISKPTDNFIFVHGDLCVSMCFGKFNGKYYDLKDLFEFFKLVRGHYCAGTVNGEVEVGALSFSWRTKKRLRNFTIKFAAAFYEWDKPWTQIA